MSVGSVSPLGVEPEEIWRNYLNPAHFLVSRTFGKDEAPAAPLSPSAEDFLLEVEASSPWLKQVDRTVLLSIGAVRKALDCLGWAKGEPIGVNIGSSRGATALFEEHHRNFLRLGKTNSRTSPVTTLGNISSWVMQDLESTGPEISHSVTCSTALHALLNGVAWLNSGMSSRFIVGGSEAALTSFTFAQMKAMRIYAGNDGPYPSQALNTEKRRNSMVLGEGAAVFCLEREVRPGALAVITGTGFATEMQVHPAAISAEGTAFQKAMSMALATTDPSEVDAVVLHAPGTIKGDEAEMAAIKSIFGTNLPALTTNKWKIGHTFGASGALSLELAVLMLQKQEFIGVPYLPPCEGPEGLKKVLVNAVGFGGNAVSVLVSLP